MKKFSLVLILVWSCFFASAQTQLTPAIEITGANSTPKKIDGKYWQVLADSNAKVNLTQVKTAKFSSVKGNTYPVDPKVEAYWLRYHVKNTLNHPINLIIPGNLARVDLYIERKGKKIEKRTMGSQVRWSELSAYKRLKQFNVVLSAGEEIGLYQRDYFDLVIDSGVVSLAIESSTDITPKLAEVYEELLIERANGAYLSGFSLLAAIVAFFFFIVIREKLYLYFSTFVFLISLVAFIRHCSHLFLKEYPLLTTYAAQILILPIFFFALHFAFIFYQTKFYFPRWHKVNYLASYLLFVFTLYILLPPKYEVSIISQCVSVICLLLTASSFVLVICSMIYNKKRLTIHILIIAPALLSLITAIILVLFYSGSTFLSKYLLNILQGTYYWMLVTFSWDLILRFQKLIKKNDMEKLALIAQQKVELENQVITRTQELNQSLRRSDNLLLNILPEDVAEELKEKGSASARLFDEVTVLFTDFVNFTTISEMLSPQELVDELHNCFKSFDDIISRYGIEKIKTIGDAYLAVAGLPNPDPKHAQNIINAALDIRDFVAERKKKIGDKTFDIRIGIHSGSVVAGIVGIKKFAYDIWGDTVNTAARMEQSSERGKINVSEKTYQLVSNEFNFIYRGEIEAKNKGILKMYFVDSKR